MVRKNLKRFELTYMGKDYGIGTIKELAERTGLTEPGVRARWERYRKNPSIGLYVFKEIHEDTTEPVSDTVGLLRRLIGDNVVRLMKEQEIDRAYLAEHVGVTYNHIERLERGGVCSMGLLAKLIDFFQVEPIEMLENWHDREIVDKEDLY